MPMGSNQPSEERDKILIVDDQQVHLDFVLRMLTIGGISKDRIVPFLSSARAIAYLRQDTGKQILAIVSDLNMSPEPDGIYVIHTAIEKAGVEPSNIILYSAANSSQLESYKKALGITCVAKGETEDRRENDFLAFSAQILKTPR